MLYAIVAFPLIIMAFLALILRNHDTLIKYSALIASILSLILAIMLFLNSKSIVVQDFTWFSVGNLQFNIAFINSSINIIALLVVAVITPLIFLYSIGFMNVPSEQARFYFEISLFAASMMLFTISYSLISLFIAWELLGITSYLLIGFWYWKKAPPYAARKAITIIFIGDILFLSGIIIIGMTYNNFLISALFTIPEKPVIYVALILILLGAFSKSAEFPFEEWLPDAMEGPTPVSAFLHSSTMVKAGILLIAFILPIYAAYNLLNVILFIGIISAIIGASNALTSRHIKKILAYSTVEDLGFMFIALGLNNLMAAMMLFIAQAFYKALLFMGAGALMRANENKEDIYEIKGATINKLVYISLIFGVASLAAIFPLGGFFGKVIIEDTTSGLVYIILLFIEFVSTLYIFRWLFVLMEEPNKDIESLKINYKLLPKTMLFAMLLLVFFVSFSSIAYFYLPKVLFSDGLLNFLYNSLLIDSIIALIGIYISYLFFYKRKIIIKETYSWYKYAYMLLYNNTIINLFYLYFVEFFGYISYITEGIELSIEKLFYKSGDATLLLSNKLRKIENGQINTYALSFIFGIFLILLIIVIFYL
ncbi:MAG: NADH-quinone oxidoreductase subunit L [Candidatus Micrarchaeia archaeon]